MSESDFKPQRYYTCTAENTKLRDYKFGSQFVLNVVKNKRRSCKFIFVIMSFFYNNLKSTLNSLLFFLFIVTESVGIPPSEQYVNQSSPIALLGQTHKLHCFFAA